MSISLSSITMLAAMVVAILAKPVAEDKYLYDDDFSKSAF